ncbi:MAG: GDSL-type esterase/lipase family protein [Thermoguttaceae bacterium]|nr:GDSL-type esterase/lipase family protein [Thermoguttaceae bacterium]
MRKQWWSLVLLVALFVVPSSQYLAAQEPSELPRTLVPAERLGEQWWKERHEANKARIEQGNVDLLLIGDSITHGWDGVGAKVQEYYYGDRNYVNMGFGGDQPQHVLWRLNDAPMDKIHPKAAVLLIGINSLWGDWDHCSENTARGIRACVDKLQSLYPDIQILVLDVFVACETADNPVRARMHKTNSYLPGMFLDYKNVTVLDINHLWLDKNGNIPKELMSDFVHPGEEGYKLWGAEVESYVSKMLGVPAKEKMK